MSEWNDRQRRAAWRAALIVATLASGGPLRAQPGAERSALQVRVAAVQARIAAEYPSLEALYRAIHSHPELSLQEEKTAARLAQACRELGCEVTEKVGGHGIVALLKNGPGPTVMVRTELDALPVVEQTGLPYASTVWTRDRDGKEVGVMHACGHDAHMACLVGVGRVLASMKERWHGTLMLVGQPAEEIGAGARMMLADGLFTRFPKPEVCLALHCFTGPYGQVAYHEGPALANVDMVDITVRGKGGHGAAPHTTVDPIVLAARIILDLQTLVSREINPADPAVVTVGSIHGGTKHNIIPNEVQLQLTVRSYTDPVRKHLLDGIERIARAAAVGARAPEPIVKVDEEQFTPVAFNDVALTRRMVALFKNVLGEAHVVETPAKMAGDDFGRYGREGVPALIYFLGVFPPERVAEAAREGGRPLPSNHSDQYYPVPEPTLKTGILTMSMAALDLLGRAANEASRR